MRAAILFLVAIAALAVSCTNDYSAFRFDPEAAGGAATGGAGAAGDTGEAGSGLGGDVGSAGAGGG